MKTIQCFFLLVTSILMLTFCKKKQDKDLPKIKIETPFAGSKFNDNDDVDFTVYISDNIIIESIKINLVDVDKKAVTATITEFPKQKEYVWKSYLTIDASKINISGTYYLNVVANDGVNEESVYKEIYITETPLHKKAIYVISNEFAKGAEVQKIDSLNKIVFFTKLTGDYLAATIDNKSKQIYTCSSTEGALQAIDTKTSARLWKLDIPTTNLKYFSSIYAFNRMLYVGFYDGFFNCFNEKGELKFSTKNNSDFNYYAEKFFSTTNNIIVFEKHKSENKKRLRVYNLSGNGKQELYVDFDIVNILYKNNNSCFLLANKNNVAKLYVYSLETNTYYSPVLLDKKIICATKVNNKIVYCDGESILMYDEKTNSVGILKNNFKAEKLEYDVTTNELIALHQSVIYLIDLETGNIKKSIAVNSNASDILLQLSK